MFARPGSFVYKSGVWQHVAFFLITSICGAISGTFAFRSFVICREPLT